MVSLKLIEEVNLELTKNSFCESYDDNKVVGDESKRVFFSWDYLDKIWPYLAHFVNKRKETDNTCKM